MVFSKAILQIQKLQQKKHSILYTWLLSYVAVLLVPVIITAVTYVNTVKIVENEINNSNSFLLSRSQQQMDSLITDATRLSQELGIDSTVNDLLKVQRASDIPPYDLYQNVRKMRTYKLLNNSIDDFYIYFKNIDMVLSPDTSSDSHTFHTCYFSQGGTTYSQWRKIISGNFRGDFIPVTYERDSGRVNESIAFVRTLQLADGSPTSANIVVNLDESQFMKDVLDIGSLNQGAVFILDKNSNVLAASSSTNQIPKLNYADLQNDNGLIHQKINGKKVVISYITSSILEWKYIIITPESVFLSKVQYIQKLALAGLLFCILLGGMISYFSLRKNYNPIDKLIKLLERYQGMNFDSNHNEYSFIEHAIDKAYADLEKVDGILEQQNKMLKSHFLERLLKGKIDPSIFIQDHLALHNIQFVSEDFAVLAFYIEDFSEINKANSISEGYDPLAYYKKVQTILINMVSEVLNDKSQGFMVDIDNLMVCLINLDKVTASYRDELIRIANEVVRILEERFDISLIVSVSKVHNQVSGIPEAYQEALQAMEYKKLLDIKEIVLFEDLKELPTGDYYYPLDVEQQLINFIKIGDFQKSKLILESIFQNNFEQSILPVKVGRCLMFNLVSTMIKTINEVGDINQNDFLEELNPIDRLLGCEKIADMKKVMMDILKTFCDYIGNKSKSKNKNADLQLIDRVNEFIQQNYSDINMSISTIADYFNIHPVTLSKTYRESSGEGLLEHINRIRLKRAKQLFKEELNNLEEVAKAVGYSNTRTFTRAFKRYEGITPGKYKDME